MTSSRKCNTSTGGTDHRDRRDATTVLELADMVGLYLLVLDDQMIDTPVAEGGSEDHQYRREVEAGVMAAVATMIAVEGVIEEATTESAVVIVVEVEEVMIGTDAMEAVGGVDRYYNYSHEKYRIQPYILSIDFGQNLFAWIMDF